MKHTSAWYVINGITLYRIIAAPFLLILLFKNEMGLFKWLLALSFFTDLIDGFLARKYKVASVLGTRLDSIGDDLTVLVGMIGLFFLKWTFIKEQKDSIYHPAVAISCAGYLCFLPLWKDDQLSHLPG